MDHVTDGEAEVSESVTSTDALSVGVAVSVLVGLRVSERVTNGERELERVGVREDVRDWLNEGLTVFVMLAPNVVHATAKIQHKKIRIVVVESMRRLDATNLLID